jgi:hypothetical protein
MWIKQVLLKSVKHVGIFYKSSTSNYHNITSRQFFLKTEIFQRNCVKNQEAQSVFYFFSRKLLYLKYCKRYDRGRQGKAESTIGAWDLNDE